MSGKNRWWQKAMSRNTAQSACSWERAMKPERAARRCAPEDRFERTRRSARCSWTEIQTGERKRASQLWPHEKYLRAGASLSQTKIKLATGNRRQHRKTKSGWTDPPVGRDRDRNLFLSRGSCAWTKTENRSALWWSRKKGHQSQAANWFAEETTRWKQKPNRTSSDECKNEKYTLKCKNNFFSAL
jgi:hypothetical protein